MSIIPQQQYFYFLGFYFFLQVDGLQVASANFAGSF